MKQILLNNPQGDTNGVLRITQDFGERPWYYKEFGLKGHEGIDINQKPGVSTPVYAVFDGNCYIREGGVYGNRINLYDDIGLVASYCHLSTILVKKGQRVKAGDLIGYSGNTSYDKYGKKLPMAIHLHFMIKECNPVTGEIYNVNNGYYGSIPINYDSKLNKLYIDTQKKYLSGGLETVVPVKQEKNKYFTDKIFGKEKTKYGYIYPETIGGVPVRVVKNTEKTKNILGRCHTKGIRGDKKDEIILFTELFKKYPIERQIKVCYHELGHHLFRYNLGVNIAQDFKKIIGLNTETYVSSYAKTKWTENVSEIYGYGKGYIDKGIKLPKNKFWDEKIQIQYELIKDIFEKNNKIFCNYDKSIRDYFKK